MDYINYLYPDFIELHGDRHFMDDPTVIAGLGNMDNRKIVLIGQQKVEILKKIFTETLV